MSRVRIPLPESPRPGRRAAHLPGCNPGDAGSIPGRPTLDSLRTCLEPVDRRGSDPCGSNPVGVRLSPSALNDAPGIVLRATCRPCTPRLEGSTPSGSITYPRNSDGAECRVSTAVVAGSSPAGG